MIIAGDPDAAETQALLAAAHGSFAPDRVVLPIDPSNEGSKTWFQQHNPEALAMIEGATKEVQSLLHTAVLTSSSPWHNSPAMECTAQHILAACSITADHLLSQYLLQGLYTT